MARVVLENVCVDFPIYATQRNLRTALFNRATGGLIRRQGKKQDRVVVRALSDVTMTLEDGDRLGLIGHNGSGKSTLLKVLAGIYEPIEGRLMIEGAVTPLFDMMPGIDMEDSGYENIYTAGLLLGMSREDIERKIPQIEELSELGEYLSLPVRTYSAGMTMRLGFSLVTSLEPGILLMDEGIGAGDARFVERAEQRLSDFIGRSRIMVVASHSDKMIRTMCNKAALMQAGRIVTLGSVEDVCEQYNAMVYGVTAKKVVDLSKASEPELEDPQPEPELTSDSCSDREASAPAWVQEYPDDPDKYAVIRRVAVVDESGQPRCDFGLNSAVFIEMDYQIKEPLREVMVLIAVGRGKNYIFQTHDTDLDDSLYLNRNPGFYRASIPIPRRLLTAGTYTVFAKIVINAMSHYGEDSHPDAIRFVLSEADQDENVNLKGWANSRGNFVIVEPRWDIKELQ